MFQASYNISDILSTTAFFLSYSLQWNTENSRQQAYIRYHTHFPVQDPSFALIEWHTVWLFAISGVLLIFQSALCRYLPILYQKKLLLMSEWQNLYHLFSGKFLQYFSLHIPGFPEYIFLPSSQNLPRILSDNTRSLPALFRYFHILLPVLHKTYCFHHQFHGKMYLLLTGLKVPDTGSLFSDSGEILPGKSDQDLSNNNLLFFDMLFLFSLAYRKSMAFVPLPDQIID